MKERESVCLCVCVYVVIRKHVYEMVSRNRGKESYSPAGIRVCRKQTSETDVLDSSHISSFQILYTQADSKNELCPSLYILLAAIA